MSRIPAIGIACMLSAFFVMFLDMGWTAPESVGLAGPIVCYLFAAAIGCGVIIAVYGAITGKTPF